jgi:membrane fusion protein, copper/silver efflux system
MNMRSVIIVIATIAVVGAGGYGLYRLGIMQGQMPGGGTAAPAADPAQDTSAARGKVLYWHDPMVPGVRFDKPGKSPFMDMQLVPVYANSGGDDGKVTISPRVQQNLGVRTAAVTRGALAQTFEAVGNVAYNERDVAVVQARATGFVETLHVRAALDAVRKGQVLAELYVPDWVAAQEEYLSVRRMTGSGIDALLDAARQRMRLAGMSEDHVRTVETGGKPYAQLTVTAPIDGVIADLGAREGMTVAAGTMLFRINGLDTVWVNAEVPESLAGSIKAGMPVQARAPGLPDTLLKGRVNAILPEINSATRTLKVRIELANPGMRLVPGMFATVSFAPGAAREGLLVPAEAIIQTGKRSIVILALEGGKFEPVAVETGMEVNGQTEIRKGLTAGQQVVVSGQFLIDSEASLKAATARMADAAGKVSGSTQGVTHRGEGKVEAIDSTEVMLSHGPIPSLKWGEMTMAFKPPPSGLPKDIRVGDRVKFEFRATRDGQYELHSIAPLSAIVQKGRQP